MRRLRIAESAEIAFLTFASIATLFVGGIKINEMVKVRKNNEKYRNDEYYKNNEEFRIKER